MKIFQQYLPALMMLTLVCSGAGIAQDSTTGPAKADASLNVAKPHRTLMNEEILALIARVTEADIVNNVKQANYTYTQNQVEERLDGKGQVKSSETKTMEVLVVAGEQVERLVARDGKPLSERDAAKEEEKIQKVIDKHKNESEHDRQKREEKQAKDREDARKFVREIGDAFTFRHVGYETMNGVESYVIEAEPRSDFRPHDQGAKYLNKFRFKGWIATSEPELVRVDAEAVETLSWGLFVARLNKGAKFTLEQTKVNDEVWLPSQLSLKLDARLALLKDYKIAQVNRYSDYKKFRTESKMTVLGEVQAAPEPPK